jgi:hypothetical protein
MREKDQVLYADVMHVDGFKFLISVVEPLQLTIQAPLENETADQLGLALQGHLSLLRARGFKPNVVYVDPQSGFRALKNLFPGVLIDDGGASDYVPKVDSKIKRIKELYRAVKNGLPWKLPVSMVKHLVCYAVGRINLRRTTAMSSNMSPYRMFTGTRVNYKKSLALAFGDYAEVFDGSDNKLRSRSLPCIALHPCNNSTGSWEFLNLQTGNKIRRSNWRKMVTSQAIIDKMNQMTSTVIFDEVNVAEDTCIPEVAASETQAADQIISEQSAEAGTSSNVVDDVDQSPEIELPIEDREERTEAEQPAELPAMEPETVVPVRRSARIAQGVTPP